MTSINIEMRFIKMEYSCKDSKDELALVNIWNSTQFRHQTLWDHKTPHH